MYRYVNGIGEDRVVGTGNESSTFDDLMKAIITAYPFIDK